MLFQRLPILAAVFLAGMFNSIQLFAQTNSADISIERPQSWVKERYVALSEKIPLNKVQGGVFFQLVDDQLNISKEGSRIHYRRFIETTVNQTGVNNAAQINISFDPNYQKIVINGLYIIRNGQRIDRSQTARMEFIRTELDLKSRVYNGELTLDILLENIKPGDSVDYSYTVFGQNPIYSGLFSYSRYFQWNVPIQQQFIRVLSHKFSPLNTFVKHSTLKVSVEKFEHHTEYELAVSNQESLSVESETPSWYAPHAVVYFNEIKNWSEVVDWASPMYQFSNDEFEIISIAKNISSHNEGEAQQILSALQFVQEQIRYISLSMGKNSHMPTKPTETLNRGYGDCKDKTLLLIALLDALGFKTYPALVNTENSKLLEDIPPSINAFDHVIVKLDYQGKPYWFDPTFSKQIGSLDKLYQPDYGYALLLKENQQDLTKMEIDPSREVVTIKETFKIPENTLDPVSFYVSTGYHGASAIRQRMRLEESGKHKIAEDYKVYYQRSFPGLETNQPLTLTDNHDSGALNIEESYKINNFWSLLNEQWEVYFYPEEIRNALFEPKQSNRDAPLSIGFPNNIKMTLELVFEEPDWDFENSELLENNDFFFFSRDIKFTDDVLTIYYQYNAKTDHIPANRIGDYLKARERAIEKAGYGIFKYSNSKEETIFNIASLIALVLLIFVIIEWRLESKHRPNFSKAEYFPISELKFFILSVSTLHLYNAYWMYRNWKGIKNKTQQEIMPFWRGFFDMFWLYPLYNALKTDNNGRISPLTLLSKQNVILVTFFYIAIRVVQNLPLHTGILILLYFIPPLLLLPFIRHINQFNTENNEVLTYNSRWRFANYLVPPLGIYLMYVISLENHL